MSKFKIEITENGVSILSKKVQTLFDGDGNPVEVDQGNHRQAIGLADYADVAEFKRAVKDIVGSTLGGDFATAIADLKESVDRTAQLQSELNAKDEEIRQLRSQIPEPKAALVEMPDTPTA